MMCVRNRFGLRAELLVLQRGATSLKGSLCGAARGGGASVRIGRFSRVGRTIRCRSRDHHRRRTSERDLVICESQWELARLLFADFDVSVGHIVAQPFLLKAEVAGAVRRAGTFRTICCPSTWGRWWWSTSPIARRESRSAPRLVPGQDHAAGKRPRLHQVQVHPAVQRGEERSAAAHQDRIGG